MVAYNIGPTRVVGELNLETFWIAKHHVNAFRSFIGQCRLLDHLVLNKRKLREDLHIFNDPKLRHQLVHVVFVTQLGNTPNPYLPHQDFSRLFPHNDLWLLLYILSLLEALVLLRVKGLASWWKILLAAWLLIWLALVGVVGVVALLGVVVLGRLLLVVAHSLGLLMALLVRVHLMWISTLLGLVLILVLLHVLESVVIHLDIYFPIRLLFINFVYRLFADIFTALDHNKGIAEAIEVAPGVALDDSKKLIRWVLDVFDFGEFADDISDKGFGDGEG